MKLRVSLKRLMLLVALVALPLALLEPPVVSGYNVGKERAHTTRGKKQKSSHFQGKTVIAQTAHNARF